jgi:hypothetical protein
VYHAAVRWKGQTRRTGPAVASRDAGLPADRRTLQQADAPAGTTHEVRFKSESKLAKFNGRLRRGHFVIMPHYSLYVQQISAANNSAPSYIRTGVPRGTTLELSIVTEAQGEGAVEQVVGRLALKVAPRLSAKQRRERTAAGTLAAGEEEHPGWHSPGRVCH